MVPLDQELLITVEKIQDLKNIDDATLPKLLKKVSIAKWYEAYESHASQLIVQVRSPLT